MANSWFWCASFKQVAEGVVGRFTLAFIREPKLFWASRPLSSRWCGSLKRWPKDISCLECLELVQDEHFHYLEDELADGTGEDNIHAEMSPTQLLVLASLFVVKLLPR